MGELLFLLVGLGSWIVIGWAGGFIMRAKGRSFGAGVALAMLLGSLGFLIALVIRERPGGIVHRAEPPPDDMWPHVGPTQVE